MEPFSYLVLVPLISFICYCVLLAIILGSRKNKVVRYYTVYIAAMIIWSLGSFVMKTNFPPSTIFWNRILCIGLISMPVIFYHFTLVLTDTKNQKINLAVGYFLAFLLMIGNFSGLIMYEAYVENNVFIYTLGPLASVMAIWSLCYMFLAFINIIQKVKTKKIPFSRVKFILFGLVLVIIGGLLNLIPSLGKYPFDIVLNTINALFIAYSIYRYRFLEIHIIVKKGLSYSLYTLALTGVYIAAILGVQLILLRIIGYNNTTLTLAMAVLLALVFQPLKNTLQKGIDRLFYREKLNHQIFLRDFSKIINNVLDINELTDSLLEAVNKAIKPHNAYLILRQGKEAYAIAKSSPNSQLEEDIKYSNNHPILQWFNMGRQLLTMSEIESSSFFTSLWSMEKKQLRSMGTELIVPIKLRDQLVGLLILSEKKGGESYTQEEMDLLFTLMNNAAVVIENAKLYEDAKYEAITDGLTKLNNHRYFQEILSKCISEKTYDVFSVAMIDVDLFKLYNDLYGHSAGDRALIKIAEVIKKSTRSEDIIARYGGEEFAVIFPNIEGAASLRAIERIRRAVESCFCSSKDVNEFLTISVGVASYPRDGLTNEEILDKADSAMYAAKRSGRNQSVVYAKKDNSINLLNNKEMEKVQDSIKTAYFSAIYALAATIDAKDHYTYGHSENVSNYAVALAKAAGFDEERIDIVKNAGLLHDIGKIGVPESILTKKEALSPDEYEVMKRHVDMSISIIKHVPNLIKVIPAIMTHHERYDGKGYPRGVKGENIPIEGRCLCIVDAFDAMTTDRPYRKALSYSDALMELRKNSGIQFDPQLTELFISLFEEGNITGVA